MTGGLLARHDGVRPTANTPTEPQRLCGIILIGAANQGAPQNRRYEMATFYSHTDPAPAVLPPYVVETVRGGWGFDTLQAAQEFVAQMRANGRAARLLVAQ